MGNRMNYISQSWREKYKFLRLSSFPSFYHLQDQRRLCLTKYHKKLTTVNQIRVCISQTTTHLEGGGSGLGKCSRSSSGPFSSSVVSSLVWSRSTQAGKWGGSQRTKRRHLLANSVPFHGGKQSYPGSPALQISALISLGHMANFTAREFGEVYF